MSTGLTKYVTPESLKNGMIDDFGLPAIFNITFLFSAAAIGSTFFLLSKLSKQIKDATLSSEDISIYWV